MTSTTSSSMDLSDRVAVVTGASAGIGEAVAHRLAARGMHLVLGARRVERLNDLASALSEQHGVRCLAHGLDVTGSGSVRDFGIAADEFAGERGVHLLVNNAGAAFGVARIPSATLEDEAAWEAMLDVNVMGLLRVTRWFVGGMVERGGGHVVHMGSLAGIETYEGGSVYCASKAAVRVISKALRLELLGSGVRVCCINPGLVETEFSGVRLGSQEAADRVYDGMTPLTGDEVARAVEWVVRLPEFMNIEELNLQPVDQASAQKVHRVGST
jgi:3-hydroxy acid dehydrogenase/malonic semialdehyde reductase